MTANPDMTMLDDVTIAMPRAITLPYPTQVFHEVVEAVGRPIPLPDLDATDCDVPLEEQMSDLAYNCGVNDDDAWVLCGSQAHVQYLCRQLTATELDNGKAHEQIRVLQNQLATATSVGHALEMALRRERDSFDETVMRLCAAMETKDQLRLSALEEVERLRSKCIELSEQIVAMLRAGVAEGGCRASSGLPAQGE